MEISQHAATLSSVEADIATGMGLIVGQMKRLHVVTENGGQECPERIALWELENNQARLHCQRSDVLNHMAQAEAAPLVLVVDDEPIVLMSAVDCLTSSGFAVLEARSADQAIELLEANPRIAAIFTDVQMRGAMNGIELARLVHKRWPAIKVVVTSGNTSLSANDLPPGAGFVPKPYTADDITTALRAN